MRRTIVVGLGNPLLGDDGVGWHVVEALRQVPVPTEAAVEFDCHAGGGLALMERLAGYDRAIVIDAVQLGQGPAGSVTSLPLEALDDPCTGHLASAHEASLPTALAVGRALGVALPTEVVVIGIEAARVYEFGEGLSPAVARAVPIAVDCAARELKENPP
jgi:hydrogenase maturation protease